MFCLFPSLDTCPLFYPLKCRNESSDSCRLRVLSVQIRVILVMVCVSTEYMVSVSIRRRVSKILYVLLFRIYLLASHVLRLSFLTLCLSLI